MSLSKRFIFILVSILLLTLLCFYFCATCRSSQILSTPHSGRPLHNKIVLVYSSNYLIKIGGLEKLHPFDIQKYKRIYRQLVHDKVVLSSDVYVPQTISKKNVRLVHSQEYLDNLKHTKNIVQYLEAPQLKFLPAKILDKSVLRPFRYATGGTLLASELALEYGIGINLGGGFHHAYPDRGEGFCVYADIPIAIQRLRMEGKIKRALIIDLDVHQGNGSAFIFQNDEDVFTFSMQQEHIYPIPREVSDLDIELEKGMDDEGYLEILSNELPSLVSIPNLDIVFIVAGCDVLQGDPLASLYMSEQGVVQRDWMVVNECVKKGIPVVLTLGGGYSSNAWHAQYLSVKNIILKINKAISE